MSPQELESKFTADYEGASVKDWAEAIGGFNFKAFAEFLANIIALMQSVISWFEEL